MDHRQAMALAGEHGAAVRRDGDRSRWFTYCDGSGLVHSVWWEDAESAAVKLRLVTKYRLGGAFFWHPGGEDPTVWPVARSALAAGG